MEAAKRPVTSFNIWCSESRKTYLVGLKNVKAGFVVSSSSSSSEDEGRSYGGKGCSVCSIEEFQDLEFQREHFKGDWHRYNLKRKLKGASSVAEERFETLSEISSISASSDESDNEWDICSSPRAFYVNAEGLKLSVFKGILENPEGGSFPPHKFPTGVLMLGGGHFAGAVFDSDGNPILHKSFHSYTVRKKQGGSQSSADQKGHHHKSAGASLRRYNELSHMKKIRDILISWKEKLDECVLIFYRASSGSRTILFGKDSPLAHFRGSNKIRTLPFPTKRATFKEAQRVRETMLTCKIHRPENEERKTKKRKTQRARIRRSKSRETKNRPLPQIVQDVLDKASSSSDEEQELSWEMSTLSTSHLAEYEIKVVDEKNENDLVTSCMSGNKPLLASVIERFPDWINKCVAGGTTPLHIVTKRGHKSLIRFLLDNGGDPALKDRSRKVPYNFCPDKECRNVYKKFRGEFPDKYDYKTALIPEPLSEEAEKARLAKKTEKKKAQRQSKKEKDQEIKRKELEVKAEMNEKERFLALSDREKRAIAAEKRMLAIGDGKSHTVAIRCFQCGADMTGKVPFSYESFRFCSMNCLKNHKKRTSV